MKNKILNTIGLQTPFSRIAAILSVTTFLYLIHYQSLLSIPTVSVYSRLNIPSPSIGLTRAYWYLIHGEFQSAWNMNKLIYFVAVVLATIVVVDVIRLIRNRRTSYIPAGIVGK